MLGDDYLLEDLANSKAGEAFDACSLRLGMDDSVDDTVKFASQVFEKYDLKASIQLRLGGNNPDENIDDTNWLCIRLAKAIVKCFR